MPAAACCLFRRRPPSHLSPSTVNQAAEALQLAASKTCKKLDIGNQPPGD